jgi:hypothetical protein
LARQLLAGAAANDPGCVKTQKIEKRGERFFSDGGKSNSVCDFQYVWKRLRDISIPSRSLA